MNSPVQSPLPDPIERTLLDAVAETSIASRTTFPGSPEALAWHTAVKELEDYRAAHAPKAHLSATLFDAIQHGDDKHRAWLRQAIDDHFAGRAVLRPDQSSPKAEAAPLLDRLNYPCNGACTCGTKTHEVRHHHLTCHFRLFTEAMGRISPKPSVAAAFSPKMPLEELTPECRPPAEHEGEPFHFLTRGGGFAPAELKDGFWWICGLVGCLTPLEVGRSGWSWHSLACSPPVARPSPNIDHIADAGKEIEFDAAVDLMRYAADQIDELGYLVSKLRNENPRICRQCGAEDEHHNPHCLIVRLRTFKSHAGKGVEFDERAAILKYEELGERGLPVSEDAVDMARWVLETFKPLPAQVQVEATEEAIDFAKWIAAWGRVIAGTQK